MVLGYFFENLANLFVLCIRLLILYAIFYCCVVNGSNKVGPLQGQDICYKFLVFAKAVQNAYTNHNLNAPLMELTSNDAKWRLRRLATAYNSSISLWKCTPAPNLSDSMHCSATHLIIIRGSTTPDDWIFRNTPLVWETARGSNDATDIDSYAKIVETYLSEVVTMLRNNQVGQDGKAKIIFCGHSLGASLAEALYARTANKVYAKNCSSVGCVSFDSPGHPQTYDEVFSANDKQNIWSLNARPNIVNTLNKPCAGDMFFSCGLGSSVHFQDLSYVYGAFKAAASLVACVCLTLVGIIHETAVASHDMASIIQFIEAFDIRQERALDWPTHSHCIIKAIITTPSPVIAVQLPDLPSDDDDDGEQSDGSALLTPLSPINYNTLLSVAPSSLEHFIEGMPYRIANLEAYSKMFPSSPNPDFVILPFIGCTGQGKTFTLAKLLDSKLLKNEIDRSPLNFLIGGGINNTKKYFRSFMPGWCQDGASGMPGWCQGTDLALCTAGISWHHPGTTLAEIVMKRDNFPVSLFYI